MRFLGTWNNGPPQAFIDGEDFKTQAVWAIVNKLIQEGCRARKEKFHLTERIVQQVPAQRPQRTFFGSLLGDFSCSLTDQWKSDIMTNKFWHHEKQESGMNWAPACSRSSIGWKIQGHKISGRGKMQVDHERKISGGFHFVSIYTVPDRTDQLYAGRLGRGWGFIADTFTFRPSWRLFWPIDYIGGVQHLFCFLRLFPRFPFLMTALVWKFLKTRYFALFYSVFSHLF